MAASAPGSWSRSPIVKRRPVSLGASAVRTPRAGRARYLDPDRVEIRRAGLRAGEMDRRGRGRGGGLGSGHEPVRLPGCARVASASEQGDDDEETERETRDDECDEDVGELFWRHEILPVHGRRIRHAPVVRRHAGPHPRLYTR
jgi:hypothetical protein